MTTGQVPADEATDLRSHARLALTLTFDSLSLSHHSLLPARSCPPIP